MYKYPQCGDGGDTSFEDYLKSDEVKAIIARGQVQKEGNKKEGRRNADAGSKVQSQRQVQFQGL